MNKINAITGVNVVDPATGKITENATIKIGCGKIRSIGQGGAPESETFDGAGKYAIPGIIDTHVHALGMYAEDGPVPADYSWLFEQQKKNFGAFIRGGVTTVRDMGAPWKLIVNMAQWAEKNKTLSPRVLYSGPVFTVKGGYPDFAGRIPFPVDRITGYVRAEVTGRIQARSLVDEVADNGVHCIKICYQCRKFNDRQGMLRRMPLEWLAEVVDRAHYHGLPAAVHCALREDLRRIMHLPFDSFEHTAWDAPLEAQDVDRMAENGAPTTGTLMTFGLAEHLEDYKELLSRNDGRYEDKPLANVRDAIAKLEAGEPSSKTFGTDVVMNGPKQVRENLRLLLGAGLKILNGTDSGGALTPCGCPHWEFAQMKKCGMSELDILRSATIEAADAVHRPDLGRMEAGATADIVLLDANPLEDISAAGRVAAVFRDGILAHEA